VTGQEWYHVAGPADGLRQVEVWSGYPLQFAGQRRFPEWQDRMAADMRGALATLRIGPGEILAGTYRSTDESRCDAENRLFTNPGPSCFPNGVAGIRFERGVGPPPTAPAPVAAVEGHLYYYRYRVGGAWQWWEPAQVVARWQRVPRRLADDGSARPVWLAMKEAATAARINVFGAALGDSVPFGLRIVVHATARGPRSAPAISEMVVDGTIAAFHADADDPVSVAAALAGRMPGTSAAELEALATLGSPGPLFSPPSFVIRGAYVAINPCDERCYAGEVMIRPDARGGIVQLSGELFTLRRVTT
jgi:hypothetical protein